MSSLVTCDLASHDRPGHDPVPHRRAPGAPGPGSRPGIKQSAGKHGPGPTGKGNPYLGPRPRRGRPGRRQDRHLPRRTLPAHPRRRGKKKAIVAIGRSILVIIWHLLADPDAHFTDLGSDFYERASNPERKKRAHIHQLEALGYKVTLEPVA